MNAMSWKYVERLDIFTPLTPKKDATCRAICGSSLWLPDAIRGAEAKALQPYSAFRSLVSVWTLFQSRLKFLSYGDQNRTTGCVHCYMITRGEDELELGRG
ncbi:hypothetical protein BGP77_15300 [Saccharospirillum sp. MSK14-1]|nr:hypothetical protein BGP77_15300 [Saccharospirillum sp. MSK14-1]